MENTAPYNLIKTEAPAADKNPNDIPLLLDTVMLEGELMLSGGAEVYRVEDTMRRILKKFGYDPTYLLVITTGIYVTLNDHTGTPISVIKRIQKRSTDISRICNVNAISRDICENRVSLSEANKRLREISACNLYGPWIHAAAIIGVSAFFVIMFGGTAIDFAGGLMVGTAFAAAEALISRTELNDFCVNAFCSCIIAIAAYIVTNFIFRGADADKIIMGAIMPLVPGVPFATSIRDMLNGDYSSGSARMLEAAVVALAVAFGVGLGMIIAGSIGI